MSLFAPPIPDEHYALLGKVADAWARLEHLIDTCCIALVGCDQAGFCLTAQVIGPGRKLDALLSLLKLRGASSDLQQTAKSLAGRIQGLGEQRNRVLHDPWASVGVDDEGYIEPFEGTKLLAGLKLRFARKHAPHRHEVTAKKSLVVEHKRVDTPYLAQLLADIEAAQVKLFELSFAALAECDPTEK
jgi:hypothetical protein